jgi:hypothetical protein
MQSGYRGIVLVNTITLIITLFGNFVAGSGKFINKTVGEVSNKYDTLFTPAGYAFSIWSLIFLLLTGFCMYQWYLLKKGDDNNFISRTGYWFALSNVANVLWLVCWLNEWMALSVIVILMLLFCICMLTLRLRLQLDQERFSTLLFVSWPVAIYMGWLMVATIACVAAWLVSTGYRGGGMGEETWTIIMIITAAFLFLVLLKTRKLAAALLVGIWSFVAIAVKQWQLHDNISLTALIASSVLLIAIGIHAYKNRQVDLLTKERAL